MIDIDTLKRVRCFFGTALTNTILPKISIIGFAVMLTAVQVAFATPNPP
jgi:hypothetical protein